MSNKLLIFCLNKSNNIFKDVTILRPKTYEELILKLTNIPAFLPSNFKFYCISENQKEIEINNNQSYMLVKDILFIRQVLPENKHLDESNININKKDLVQSLKEKFEEKYSCSVCDVLIKGENPYFCYNCQKLFHSKCLEDWDKKRRGINQKLNCPNCRNELDLEKWNKKLDFEENKNDELNSMKQIIQFHDKNTINLKTIKGLNQQNKESIKYIKEFTNIFRNLLIKMLDIKLLYKSDINNNLINMINYLSSPKFIIPPLTQLYHIFFNELEDIEQYIKNIYVNNNIKIKSQNKLKNSYIISFNILGKIKNKKNYKIINNINYFIKPDKKEKKNYKIINNINYFIKPDNKKNEIKKLNFELYEKKYSNKIELNKVINNNIDIDHYFNINKELNNKIFNNNQIDIDIKEKSKQKNDIINNDFKIYKNNNDENEANGIKGDNKKDININENDKELININPDIKMIYKNDPILKIFGFKFVKNNKEKCKIVYNNKLYALKEYFKIIDKNDYNKEQLEIGLTGLNDVKDLSYMFYNCPLLISIIDISKINISNITNIHFMFSGCSSLESLPDILNWDISNVNDMRDVFSDCSALTKLPNISNWNTNKINDMSNLFSNCTSLKYLPDISKWNTANVIDMNNMFFNCSSLLTLPDISKWNVKNVINMSQMFGNCSSLESLPNIIDWNKNDSVVIDSMFLNCNIDIPEKFQPIKRKRKITKKIIY